MMSSREKILGEIKAEAVSGKENIISPIESIIYADKKKQFVEVLTMIGGKALDAEDVITIENFITDSKQAGKKVINVFGEEAVTTAKDELYSTEIAILKGGIAVAENGTIWVTEKNMGNRMLPFCCEQLVIVIEEKNIVNNMHEAYDRINIAEDGYGVFIAGPSKTADIEQSLVIGAHGPVDFLVFILN